MRGLMELLGKPRNGLEDNPAFIALRAKVKALEDLVVNYKAKELVTEFLVQTKEPK